MSSYNSKTSAEEVAENNKSVIAGKVVLVTGASPGGLGASFVQIIARYSPKLLILAGRDISKSQETASTINSSAPDVETRILELDLGSQKQIRKAAAEVNLYSENIEVLVNNAGLLATGPGARVVSVASNGYRLGPIRFDDWKFADGKRYDPWRAYGQSKTANMLFAVSLAEKTGSKGLVAVSLCPGAVSTNLGRWMSPEDLADLEKQDRDNGDCVMWDSGLSYKTLSEGTATHVFAAFDPSVQEHNGAHLANTQILPLEKVRCWGRDNVEAERLWKLSEEIVGQKFSF